MTDRRKKPSKFNRVVEFIRHLFGRPPAAPGDPYAYVMDPVRRGPHGRSGAAVAEIEDDSFRAFPPR